MIKVIVKDVCTQRETIWEVIGNNEVPCANDIRNNNRKELTAYVQTMFKQRYGCTARIITEIENELCNVCYMCCERNCKIDCYYNVGGVCKYCNESYSRCEDEPQCNPEECHCFEEGAD